MRNKKYDKKYYVVRIGKKYESKSYKTKTFKGNEETERDLFIQNWNESLEKKDASTLGMMSALQLAKLNLCLKKLEGKGIELETCVDFYLKHNTSVNAQTKLLEAVTFWKKIREQRGDRKRSIQDAEMTTLRPFSKFVKNKSIGSITKADVRNYLFSKPDWSIETKKLHKRNLSAFFNLLRRNGFANLNPASDIDLPKVSAKEKAFYKQWEVWLYLDTCLQNKKWTLLGGASIAAFFGGRLRETTRVDWDQIIWESKRITYFRAQTKTRTRRILYRTKVGFAWLGFAMENSNSKKNTSEYASRVVQPAIKKAIKNWSDLIERKSPFEYEGQNMLRQGFEAHAYQHFNYDLKTLSEVSGNSEETLKSNYNGILDNPDDAIAYFHLYPREVFTDGVPLAKEMNLVGDEEVGNYEKSGWKLVTRFDKDTGKLKCKVFKPKIESGALVVTKRTMTEEEYKTINGDDVFEFRSNQERGV